ncbi:hypothetical protein ABT340_39530 [Streptosporangium sp. NPDC000239]|uniref:hypothetical protein n=1 Tax=Streptosporangium sp. NPDC000239 TaxID=3154248 RepID=UPI00332AB5E1
MKVYLASRGSYSTYRVVGVFARKEDAEAYELGEDVEEYDVHEGPQEVRAWLKLIWYPDHPDKDTWEGDGPYNPYEDMRPERRDYDGHPNRVEHRWARGWGERGSGHLEVCGWEIERIRKVFGELRAQWLSNRTLGMVWDCDKLEWTAPEVES